MKPNSQRNKMLKGRAKKIFSIKTMTRKKKRSELTWANYQTCNLDHGTKMTSQKERKNNYEAQSSINSVLKDDVGKKN